MLNQSAPIRIAVLSHALRVAGGVSVGTNLLAALARVAPQHQYLVTIPKDLGYEEVCARFPSCRSLPLKAAGFVGRWVFEKLSLRRELRAFRPDVLLALGNSGLLRPGCPQAVLCQDAHYFYPRTHFGEKALSDRLVRWLRSRRFRAALKYTTLLLCQTGVAQARLRQTSGFKGPICLCPNGVADIQGITEAESLPPHIASRFAQADGKLRLLCLSRYYPHKNLERIVQTFERFGAELQNVTVFLTIAADQHPGAARLLDAVDRLGLVDQIVNVGPVPQASVSACYEHCDALLLPTLLESHSGSYLEAMKYGVPVLTSDLDFAQAICGEAALYFDPREPRAIRDAIVRFGGDPALKAGLAAAAKRRVATEAVPWDQTAEVLIRQLEAVVWSKRRVERGLQSSSRVVSARQ